MFHLNTSKQFDISNISRLDRYSTISNFRSENQPIWPELWSKNLQFPRTLSFVQLLLCFFEHFKSTKILRESFNSCCDSINYESNFQDKMIAIGMIREMGRLGALVGQYPVAFIFAGVLLTIPGIIGFWRFDLDAEMNGGFVTRSAPSNQEIDDQQSFFNASGKPFYMALFGHTKHNLLEYDIYNELDTFYEKTMNMNLTIDNGTEYYQFKELCHPVCQLNEQLQKLMV